MLTWVLLLLPLLLSPASCGNKTANEDKKPSPTATPTPPTTDTELVLPTPSLLQWLWDMLDGVWTDKEAESRQGPIGGGIRLTLGALVSLLLGTVLGVVGFGSVGLLAAKALSVGTLALFLTAITSLKKHKGDSGGQTVHYVPIQTGHHEYLHDRSDRDRLPLPPYLDRKF